MEKERERAHHLISYIKCGADRMPCRINNFCYEKHSRVFSGKKNCNFHKSEKFAADIWASRIHTDSESERKASGIEMDLMI